MATETAYWDSADLDEHVALIKRQVVRSLRDGETTQLAARLVSGQFDYTHDRRSGRDVAVVKAWGKYYRAPESAICRPRDTACEINAIWDFLVMNVRYVEDPEGIDTFRTLRLTLEAGGGDCDDATIAFCALLRAVGYKCVARVISTDASGGRNWEHIYPMVGLPKAAPKKFLPLDITVNGATPGWQYGQGLSGGRIAKLRDFWM